MAVHAQLINATVLPSKRKRPINNLTGRTEFENDSRTDLRMVIPTAGAAVTFQERTSSDLPPSIGQNEVGSVVVSNQGSLPAPSLDLLADVALDRLPRRRRVALAPRQSNQSSSRPLPIIPKAAKLVALNLAITLRLEPFPDLWVGVVRDLLTNKGAVPDLTLSPTQAILLDIYLRHLASFREIDSRIYMEILRSPNVEAKSLLESLQLQYTDLFVRDVFLDERKVTAWIRTVRRSSRDISYAVRPYRHVVVELSHQRWVEEIILPELHAVDDSTV